MKRMRASLAILFRLSVLFAVTGVALLPSVAMAEEGGSGHYLPGSMSSFVDGVPLTESVIFRLNVLNYNGEASKSVTIPVARTVTAGLKAESTAIGLSVAWRPSWGGSGDWSYAMSATIPYVWIDVSGDVAPLMIHQSDSLSGLGDIVLMPVLLNYNVNPDFNINTRLCFYAPTGSYEVGRLANTGKNFWTIEPTVAFMYFGQKNGREASLFLGADFNQENPDTHYKSGTQVHADGTLAQHFPLWGGLAGAGITAFWYQQVTGDSGSGATLGDFKAWDNGIGPVVSFAGKSGSRDVIGELKWLHEYGVKNRLSGDAVFFKMLMKF